VESPSSKDKEGCIPAPLRAGVQVVHAENEGPVFATADGKTLYSWPLSGLRNGQGALQIRPMTRCAGSVVLPPPRVTMVLPSRMLPRGTCAVKPTRGLRSSSTASRFSRLVRSLTRCPSCGCYGKPTTHPEIPSMAVKRKICRAVEDRKIWETYRSCEELGVVLESQRNVLELHDGGL
jgi:hypothetical protein